MIRFVTTKGVNVAYKAKYPVPLTLVVSQEHQDEIVAIAAKRNMSKGAVVRDLIKLGLIEFYKRGGLPSDADS